jgi:ABC-type methionine transport system ATPase subunit
MTTYSGNDSGNDFSENSLQALQLTKDTESLGADQPTQTRIRLRIPKEYTDQPVISQLVSEYGLTVNIAAALLGPNTRDDGWFDLELRGTSHQIQSALTYLNERKFEIWDESDQGEGGW